MKGFDGFLRIGVRSSWVMFVSHTASDLDGYKNHQHDDDMVFVTLVRRGRYFSTPVLRKWCLRRSRCRLTAIYHDQGTNHFETKELKKMDSYFGQCRVEARDKY